MNIDKVREWVADLRSDKHPQCQQKMHYGDAYCCLGRAVEVIYGDNADWRKLYSDFDLWVLDGNTLYIGLPPYDVQLALGICHRNPELGILTTDLVNMNDRGKTFAEIADVIEQHLNVYLERQEYRD